MNKPSSCGKFFNYEKSIGIIRNNVVAFVTEDEFYTEYLNKWYQKTNEERFEYANVEIKKLISLIKNHTLGEINEAFFLYFSLCDLLRIKYGLLYKSYDEEPLRRGKEWLDIHHVLEFQMDDIAKRTKYAKLMETRNNQTDAIDKTNEQQLNYYTLDDLKPFNKPTQLVYANKAEHFLLHYLIDSLRGKDCFSGGPNFLWDVSVALDLYDFKEEYLAKLSKQKENFYSIISSNEITHLYKKLIDWKQWDISKCSKFWIIFNTQIFNIKKAHYIQDTQKFFQLLAILNFKLNDDIVNAIRNLPFKIEHRVCRFGEELIIHGDAYKTDGVTIQLFNCYAPYERKSFKIPSNVQKLSNSAFYHTFGIETLTIPKSVIEIEDTTLNKCPYLKKIIFLGSSHEWNARFSNIKTDKFKIIYKEKDLILKIYYTKKPFREKPETVLILVC